MSTPLAVVHQRLRAAARQPDEAIDLGETALALASLPRPGLALGGYRRLLHEIGEAAARCGGAAEAAPDRAAVLRRTLRGRYGFQGSARAEADGDGGIGLLGLLDRRRGPGAPLALLYLNLARSLGWPAHALAFPANLLVRVGGADGQRVIVDPFDGRVLDAAGLRALLKASCGAGAELRPEHYAPLSNRQVLLHIQEAAKLRLLRGGQLGPALAAVEGALLLAPEEPALWREAGLLHLRLGQTRAAVAALEHFVASTGSDHGGGRRIASLLRELRERLP